MPRYARSGPRAATSGYEQLALGNIVSISSMNVEDVKGPGRHVQYLGTSVPDPIILWLAAM